MTRPFFARIFLVLSLFAITILASHAQNRTFTWERWDVVIDNINTSQNSFRVTEIYRVRFTGTFTFGNADIPKSRVSSFEDIAVYVDGEPLNETCPVAPGTFCTIDSEDLLSVEYSFRQPVSDRTVDIRLEYAVNGGLRSYIGGDQIYWMAVTDDHAAPIESSAVVVNLPSDAIPRTGVDPIATYGVDAEIALCTTLGTCAGVDTTQYIDSVDGAVVVARSLRALAVNEPLEIRVQYPHNPQMPAPIWQAAFDEARRLEESTPPATCDMANLAQQQQVFAQLLTLDFERTPELSLANLYRLGAMYQQLALGCGYLPSDSEINAQILLTLSITDVGTIIAANAVGGDVDAILAELETVIGDSFRGNLLYNGMEPSLDGSPLGCAGCHEGAAAPLTEGTFTRVDEQRLLLPQFADYTVERYLVESIVHPELYVVEGYAPGLMPTFYGQRLDIQDMADILAYLLSQDQAIE